jgi:hypothetical protein
MTPEEKAKQLMEKYCMYLRANLLYAEDAKEDARVCALIAVDEIVESRKDDIAFDDTMWENASEYYEPHPMYLNYWKRVKQEIEKL